MLLLVRHAYKIKPKLKLNGWTKGKVWLTMIAFHWKKKVGRKNSLDDIRRARTS